MMKTVYFADRTLRTPLTLCFKEKLELVKLLDRLKLDVIELPAPSADKGEQLTNKTLASVVTASTVSVCTGATEDSVDAAWEIVRNAKKPAMQVSVPVSTVRMEYEFHKKTPALIEMIGTLVRKARYYCETVEFTAEDATRAEPQVVIDAIRAALDAGATVITVCDSAGIMLPNEMGTFVQTLRAEIPALANVRLAVELHDELHMAVACAAEAIAAGADTIKTTVNGAGYPAMEEISRFIQQRGASLELAHHLRVTELSRAVKQVQWMLQTQKDEQSAFNEVVSAETSNLCLDQNDSITEVIKAIHQLGYDLSEADNTKVYEEFRRVAAKKRFVGTKELESIIASCAMQVPSTYRISNYVINCGNIIMATANLELEKDGQKVRGVGVGNGPIDAAFLALEQIIGHHYELDDFQVQAVTEGKEAMGSALVKLRSGGRLYSGNGISTDIIGAAIRAYVNALNKIMYEEG